MVSQKSKFARVENQAILPNAIYYAGRFQKALGVAPSQESSGDISKFKVSGGSALCRRALWQWVFSAVEPARRRTNLVLKELGQFLDVEKAAGKPVKLIRMRVAVKAVKLLFKELVLSRKVVD